MAAEVVQVFGPPADLRDRVSDGWFTDGAQFDRRSAEKRSNVDGARRESSANGGRRFGGADFGRIAKRRGGSTNGGAFDTALPRSVRSPVEPDGHRHRGGRASRPAEEECAVNHRLDVDGLTAYRVRRGRGRCLDSSEMTPVTSPLVGESTSSGGCAASRSGQRSALCSRSRPPLSPLLSRASLFLVLCSALTSCSGLESAALRDYRFNSKNVTALLDSLLAKNHYDNRIRPDFGGPPVLVTVNMHIKSMGPVSETDEMYAMDCYFRQVWYDRRLRFNLSGLNEFSMSWIFLEKVWKPDTFFMNGKKSYLHRITVPNKFIRLRSDGFLTYSIRLTIKARCRMHLRKFPLDSQACPLHIGSYGYSSKDVLYQWQGTSSVGLEPGVELAQYDLVSIETEGEELVVRDQATFSVISVHFFLKRHTGYFMLQVYVPCGLIVSCSWVSFWIDPDAVPARVSLGVTTVLSMTTMGFGGRSQMPKVSYATALDWFVILCFSFVFAVMVEYAAINFIDKIRTDLKRKMDEEKKKREAEEKKEGKEGLGGGEEEDEEERKKRRKKEEAEGARKGGAEEAEEEKMPEGFTASLVLGGVGDHEIVRVIVETVGDEPVRSGVGGMGKEGGGGGGGRPVGGGVGRKGTMPTIRDNVEWEEDVEDYDEDDEELDVVGNGAGPEEVVEMAVSDSPDRLGVGCDVDIGSRRERSVTASPVDTPKWQNTLLAPIRAWRSSRLISRDDLGSAMVFWGNQSEQGTPGGANGTGGDAADASVPAGKFSRIDITARKMFPITFLTLIWIYWVAYMYYITDEYEAWGAVEEVAPKRNVVFVAG